MQTALQPALPYPTLPCPALDSGSGQLRSPFPLSFPSLFLDSSDPAAQLVPQPELQQSSLEPARQSYQLHAALEPSQALVRGKQLPSNSITLEASLAHRLPQPHPLPVSLTSSLSPRLSPSSPLPSLPQDAELRIGCLSVSSPPNQPLLSQPALFCMHVSILFLSSLSLTFSWSLMTHILLYVCV